MASGPAAAAWREAAFTAVILLVVAGQGLLTWWSWSSAYLIAACVLAPTAVLLCTQLARDVYYDDAVPAAGAPASAAGAIAWLLLMPALFVLLGLVAAGGVYTFVYLRWRSRERPATALALAAVVAGLLAVLAWVLNKPQLYQGPVW